MTYAWDNGDEFAFGSNNTRFTIPKIEHNIFPKTNQGLKDETTSACTMYGAWNQIIRLFGLDLSMEEANNVGLEIVKFCTNYGYTIGYGRSTPTALNAVCKWWNTIGYTRYNKEKVFYEKLSRGDEKIKEAMEKGHLIGFTYNLNRNQDRYKGLVDKDDYKGATGHRSNIKSPKLTNATSGLKVDNANEGVHDSYYMRTNEYYIKDIGKYVLKGVYANFYIILPQSCLVGTVEENKEAIKQNKAVNCLIGVMSSTYGDIEQEFQLMSSAYATALREKYKERPLENDVAKKNYQAVVDVLSYCWKNAGEEEQEKYQELASYLRKKHGLK